MTGNPLVFIEHILECIALIEKYIHDKSSDDFFASIQLQDAIIRRLEIIGEATKNLSEDFKEKHPHTPWRQIAGMRDVLIHEYFGVDLDLTWQVIRENMPELKQQLLLIKQSLS